jgi:zinc protease
MGCIMYIKLLVLSALLLSGSPLALATPHIQNWQSPNGARVYFVENHDLPMLDITITFSAGSGFDVAEKSGLAGLTHRMLDLGAGSLNEDEIARNLADIGAQLGKNFDADRSGISLRTLSSVSERTQAMGIFKRIVQQPLFQESILIREKARLVASLGEEETKPSSIAEKMFNKAVFGTHPYGLHHAGEIISVEHIKRTDIEEFYRAHYFAKNSVVAIMGDITRAQAEIIAHTLTQGLPSNVELTKIEPVVMQIKAGEQRVDHPATQSHILIGTPGLARKDVDYFPLYVGNHILGGGGFISRLMHEIREKHGLAYSVYSYFIPMNLPGAYQIGLQTKKEQADEALQLVRTILHEFINKGVTEHELKSSKQNIIGGFPLRIDSNRKIVDYLSMIGFYGLPLTYLDDFVSNVDRVTAEQIRTVFKRRINPDAMATVIVGAPEPTK